MVSFFSRVNFQAQVCPLVNFFLHEMTELDWKPAHLLCNLFGALLPKCSRWAHDKYSSDYTLIKRRYNRLKMWVNNFKFVS